MQMIAELEDREEMVTYTLNAVWTAVEGVNATAVNYDFTDAFEALVMASIHAAIKAGYPLEEIQEVFNSIVLQNGDEDGDY